jgi:hypothetical protein
MNQKQQNPTLDELKVKFDALWLRGTGWQLEMGEVLHQIKLEFKSQEDGHSKWGKFLSEYDLARSTADDYIRRYKQKVDIAETRQFDEPNPEPEPDPEAEERMADIEAEQKKRQGKERVHHPTEVRVRLKDLRPDQTSEYWRERKANPGRVDAIWLQALNVIIRAEALYPPPLGTEPVPEEEAVCIVS